MLAKEMCNITSKLIKAWNQRLFHACFAYISTAVSLYCHSMRTHMCCRVAQTSAGVYEPHLSRSLASIAFNLVV